MKRLILASLLICGIAITAQAQKVYKDGTMFVIECAGMPAGSYTKTPKPRTTDGTIWTMGSNTAANLGSAVNNEKVAYKFEVAAANNGRSADWLSAVNRCAGLSGGNWRLPTLRELILIYIQDRKLQSLDGFTSLSVNIFWSATEYIDYKSFTLNCTQDSTNSSYKMDSFYTRCIRDL